MYLEGPTDGGSQSCLSCIMNTRTQNKSVTMVRKSTNQKNLQGNSNQQMLESGGEMH